MHDTLWVPPVDAWNRTRIGAFAQKHAPDAVGDYEALWRWSVEETEAFWTAIWNEFDILSDTPPTNVVSTDESGKVTWFEGTALNYAEHMVRGNGLEADDVAVVSESQSRERQVLTLEELREQVRLAAAGLRRFGVERGDRVVAFLPNVHESLVAFLATASIGAIWSSCAPEFGVRAVVDRWSQIEPKVLLTIDGYRYGSKDIDLSEPVAAIRAELPTVAHTVALRYLDGAAEIPDSHDWDDFTAPCDDVLVFERVAFDHPLYVLFSSGTTGLPKAIVHGHGGVLLEHSKHLGLQMDMSHDDRFFWFSTTGWMMWNFLISGLLLGSSVVLFDGNPGYPGLDELWSLIARTETTFAGLSAPFIIASKNAELTPGESHDLSSLRGLGSTGAPLPTAGFRWAHEYVADVPLWSMSGGTDVCSAFLGGSPVTPVVAGVIPCRQLGWSVDSYSPDAQSIRNQEGELVITKPAPSMPVSFWGDAEGIKYRDAYYSMFPGTWQHGDWITIADDGSCVISGRSDATLNRGGVRLGTADFYSVVDADSAVADSLIIHLEDDQGGLGELLLFVELSPGAVLDDDVRSRLSRALRSELSPRHVPDDVVAVTGIPRTLSGKKLEIPVKRILCGVDPEQAASKDALANPETLAQYVDFSLQR